MHLTRRWTHLSNSFIHLTGCWTHLTNSFMHLTSRWTHLTNSFMHLTSVGSGEFHVTANPDDVLIVSNLGEAIAMMIFDPVAKVGGMLHFPLPDSGPAPDRCRNKSSSRTTSIRRP